MKYNQVLSQLREGIESGRYTGRIPSENELAQRYAISRPTAARAIRELQQAGLVERRVGSGSFVVPLKDRTSPAQVTLGLLVPGLKNTEVLEPICNEIFRYAQSKSISILWNGPGEVRGEVAEVNAVCDGLLARGVKGVFFAPLESVPDRAEENARLAEKLKRRGVQVVLLDRDIGEYPARSCHDLVSVDSFAAGFSLCEHLVGLGHRRLLFLAPHGTPSTTDLRVAGCRDAALRHGVPFDRDAVVYGDPTDVAFVASIMVARRRPDAVICTNDRTAALLIQTLSSLSHRPPQDISVAGFDDVNYATLLSTPLTTMRQPLRDIARAAVHAMLDRLADPSLPPRQILLPAELVIRQSCGAK